VRNKIATLPLLSAIWERQDGKRNGRPVGVADGRLQERLSQYMCTLTEAGISEDFLVVCAAEFIKEQMNPDRRYSGC
jgi:hypothetical protein